MGVERECGKVKQASIDFYSGVGKGGGPGGGGESECHAVPRS